MARASGRLLAGRYELSGRERAGGVLGRAEALDTLADLPVLLDAVPLPETVGAEEWRERSPLEKADPVARRAVDQAELAARVLPEHARLLQVFDTVEESGYLWVVGERVPGVPLARVLEHGPLSPYRAAEIAGDVVSALRAVHRTGRWHGNVTPDTVVVCEDGAAFLGGHAVSAAQESLCSWPETPPAPAPAAPGARAAAPAGAPAPAGGGYRGGWAGEGQAAPEPGASEAPPPAPGQVGTRAVWTPARGRARDARMVIIGTVAERWAPELTGPTPAPPAARPAPAAQSWLVDAEGAAEPGPAPTGPPTGDPIGPPADAWAVGVLLYRMLTGDAPFPEDADAVNGTTMLLEAVRSGEHRSTELCGPLRPLVEQLLHRDPAARPPLGEVQARLAGLLSRAPEPQRPEGVLPVAALMAGPEGPPSLEDRRRRALVPHPEDTHGHHHGRHAAPHRRGGRALGPLLVGGIVAAVLLTLVVVALTAAHH